MLPELTARHAGRSFHSVVIVIHFSLSVKQYAQAEICPGRDIGLPERCPQPECQAEHSLIRWGTYQRWACTERGDYRLRIQRVRCQGCGRSHSLLPDFLHPYRHYVLKVLYRVVWLYLIVGLGFERLQGELPSAGPARSTVRAWIRDFAYGAGYLLVGALSRFLLMVQTQSELPGRPPVQLERSRDAHLSQAYHFWQLAEQLYAQVKLRLPGLHFTPSQLLAFSLHWLQAQSWPPRLFWNPTLPTTPVKPWSTGPP